MCEVKKEETARKKELEELWWTCNREKKLYMENDVVDLKFMLSHGFEKSFTSSLQAKTQNGERIIQYMINKCEMKET